MLTTIGSIVLKYWVEFLLGLIVAGGGFLMKRYLKLEKAEHKRDQEKNFKVLTEELNKENKKTIEAIQLDRNNLNQAINSVEEKSEAGDLALQNQISQLMTDLSSIKAGMLSVQGKEFKMNCRRLLDESHEITLDEWEEIDADHEAYNQLGGNHRGDQLYNLVKKRAERFLTD